MASAIFSIIWLLLSAAAAMSQASTFSGGLMASSYCGEDYCLSAIYSPAANTINYTLAIPFGGGPVGWWAIGQGTQMKGANMAVCWVNPDESLTISHRTATGQVYPIQASASTPTLTPNNATGLTRADLTLWSWNMPLPANAKLDGVQHIFAASPVKNPSSAATSAKLVIHSRVQRNIKLDLTTPLDASQAATPAGVVTNADGQLTWDTTSYPPIARATLAVVRPSRKRLVIVHVVFMLLAWLICVPLGILLTRYGRAVFTWLPAHRAVHVVAVVLTLVGLGVGVAAVDANAYVHLSNGHEQVGVALVVLLVAQALLGVATHELKKRFGKRAVALIHIPLGLGLFPLSVYNIHTGFAKVFEFAVPAWASYVVYAWAALMAAVYVVGFYKVRRELAYERDDDQRTMLESRRPSAQSEKSVQSAVV